MRTIRLCWHLAMVWLWTRRIRALYSASVTAQCQHEIHHEKAQALLTELMKESQPQ